MNPTHLISLSRAARNRNPGNLRPRHNPPTWPGQSDIDTGAGGPFAKFASDGDGWCALGLWLLFAHDVMGLKTTLAKISVFAPPADSNDTASYARQVAAKVGEHADPHNPAERRKLAMAIAHVESPTVWTGAVIAEGMALTDKRWPAFRFATSGRPPGSMPPPEPTTTISEADALNQRELDRIKGLKT